jgi:hypothetical protein
MAQTIMRQLVGIIKVASGSLSVILVLLSAKDRAGARVPSTKQNSEFVGEFVDILNGGRQFFTPTFWKENSTSMWERKASK